MEDILRNADIVDIVNILKERGLSGVDSLSYTKKILSERGLSEVDSLSYAKKILSDSFKDDPNGYNDLLLKVREENKQLNKKQV